MLQLLEFPVVFLVFMGLGFLVGGLLGVQVLGVIMMPVLFRGVFDITMRAWAHFCWFGLCSVDFLVGAGSYFYAGFEGWAMVASIPLAQGLVCPCGLSATGGVKCVCRDVDVAFGLGFLRVIRTLALLRCRAPPTSTSTWATQA